MRRFVTLFAVVTAVGGAPASATPAPARASEWHPVFAVTGGARFFRGDLALESDAAYGIRAALVEDRHLGLLLDYVETRTIRDATHHAAEVRSLRALGRFAVLNGQVRPYLLAGIGGILVQFHDVPSAALGALTAGAGSELRLGDRWRPFIEGTMEFYDYEPVFYSSTGAVRTLDQRGRSWIDTVVAGLAVTF